MRAKASAADAGKRLGTFLAEHLDLSGREIKRSLELGSCRVNGVIERFASKRLNVGDSVTFEQKTSAPTQNELPILYEDSQLMICNKPSGLPCEVGRFRKILGLPVSLVHRLDKGTSGALLIAKNEEMKSALEDLFRKREVEKVYRAIVKGRVRQDQGLIETHLEIKGHFHGQTMWGSSSKGKLSTTEWKCLKRGKGMSLLECRPKTGRTHQLRVHLSEMGHPVLGDLQYGRNVQFPPSVNRLLLHAYRLAFIHPKTEEKLRVTAPIPQEFEILPNAPRS